MARLNIEDSLWSDPRFMRLCIKLGDERTAVGAVMLAWKIAQKHWCPGKQPIPNFEWVGAGIGREMIDVGLAREMGEGVYVCGSEEHFSWWFKKHDAAIKGGKKSVEKRLEKYGSAAPGVSSKQSRTSDEAHASSVDEAPKKLSEPSSSSSSSSSKKKKEEERTIHDDLRGVQGSELLATTSLRAQTAWIKTFGAKLIRDTWPLIYAAWETDDERRSKGNFAKYARRFLENQKNKTDPNPQKKKNLLVVKGGGLPWS